MVTFHNHDQKKKKNHLRWNKGTKPGTCWLQDQKLHAAVVQMQRLKLEMVDVPDSLTHSTFPTTRDRLTSARFLLLCEFKNLHGTDLPYLF